MILCDENALFGGSLRGAAITIDGAPPQRGSPRESTSSRRARGHATAAHHGVRLLRSESRRPVRARRRSSAGAAAVHGRASACGTSAQASSCSRAARRSAASLTRTTICQARCSPAQRIYVDRYAVKPGTRAVVFTNNDSAYGAALAPARAGVAVASIADARPEAAIDGERRAGRGMQRLADLPGAQSPARMAVYVWRRSTSSPRSAARRIASNAISSAFPEAGTPPFISIRRRAASFATTSARDVRARRLPASDHRRRRGERHIRLAGASPTVTLRAAPPPRGRASPRARHAPRPQPASRAGRCTLWRVPSRARRANASSICRTTSLSPTSRSPRAKATARSST